MIGVLQCVSALTITTIRADLSSIRSSITSHDLRRTKLGGWISRHVKKTWHGQTETPSTTTLKKRICLVFMEQKEFSAPIPPPKPGTSQHTESAKPWYLVSPGIWELMLNKSQTGEKSVLQYYEPNATTATDTIITHSFIEEVCFLDGALADLTLGQQWGQGSYAYRLPGMKHGPYKASDRGVLMFVKCMPIGSPTTPN